MTPPGTRLVARRLVLEPFTEVAIGPQYLGWLNDPQVTRFSNQRFSRHTGESARSYLATFDGSDNLLLAIRLADGGRMIGTMTAYIAVPHGTADMGLMIGDRRLLGPLLRTRGVVDSAGPPTGGARAAQGNRGNGAPERRHANHHGALGHAAGGGAPASGNNRWGRGRCPAFCALHRDS